jgi:hypothetical protein
MDRVKTPTRDAVADRMAVDPCTEELRPRHDSMLRIRQPGDHVVRVFTSTAYDRLN